MMATDNLRMLNRASQGGPRVIFNDFYLEKYKFEPISEEEKVSYFSMKK